MSHTLGRTAPPSQTAGLPADLLDVSEPNEVAAARILLVSGTVRRREWMANRFEEHLDVFAHVNRDIVSIAS